MRNATNLAKKIAKLYYSSIDGLKLATIELLALCNLEYINEYMEFWINKALNKLHLELLCFPGYYLVIRLK